MFNFLKPALLAVIVALSGCAAKLTMPSDSSSTSFRPSAKPASIALLIAAAPNVQASADWQAFRIEWGSAFNASAAAAAMPARYLENEPARGAPGTLLIKVNVNNYRYVTSATRFGFGIMTGNAFVDAEAEFVELPARRSLGKRKYATSSSAWQGVFSAMTDKQLRALSDAMLRDATAR